MAFPMKVVHRCRRGTIAGLRGNLQYLQGSEQLLTIWRSPSGTRIPAGTCVVSERASLGDYS